MGEQQEREPRRRVHTMCHDCDGRTVVFRPRAYVGSDGFGTMTQTQTCPTCKGKGKFPGVQPPA